MSNEWAHRMEDASVSPAAFALGTAANSTRSAQVDLGTASDSGLNPRLEDMEFSIVGPAMTVAQLANGQTVTYAIQHSETALAGWVALSGTILTQTGAGGVGAATSTTRYRLPTATHRYINLIATTSAGGGDPSPVSAELKVLF